MNFDPSYIIGAFVAMGSAIVALALAIGYLWRQQVKQNAANDKKFAKMDEELKKAIRERCIRGGGEPRPCLKDQTCQHKKNQDETKQFLHPLALIIGTLVIFALTSCSFRLPHPAPDAPVKTIEQVIAEKTAVEQQRDQAITTSAQAKQAAAQARKDAESAKAYAEEKDQEAKRLDAIAKELRNQEIAAGITRTSWWMAGSGIVALALGIFLVLRFGGKTALAITIAGAGAFGLGLIGLLIAPHWIAWAWGIAIAVILSIIAGITYLLHDHFRAATEMVHGIQNVKDRFFPKLSDGTNTMMREEINKILIESQKKHRKTIQRILGK